MTNEHIISVDNLDMDGVGMIMRGLAHEKSPLIFWDDDGTVELRWIDGYRVIHVELQFVSAYHFDRTNMKMIWNFDKESHE